MLMTIKKFLREEDGLGTVELVLLIAILVGLALIFRNVIVDFVQRILRNIDGVDVDPQDL